MYNYMTCEECILNMNCVQLAHMEECCDRCSNNYLAHVGTPHQGNIPHSGRYEYGSGENAFQRDDFRRGVLRMRKEGLTEDEIRNAYKMTTTEYRKLISITKSQERIANIERATALKEKGYSQTKIGEIMGVNESVVRSWLQTSAKERATRTNRVSEVLKANVDSGKYLDVGAGTEKYIDLGVDQKLGISNTRLNTAVKQLVDTGEYERKKIQVAQINNPNQKTTVTLLVPKGTPTTEIYEHLEKIGNVQEFSSDGAVTTQILRPPVSVDSSRIYIRYGDQGGKDRDGTIELRRNVPDLTMGNASYAQTRIAVDNAYYLKGMAFYKDDIPDGYDIVYNTNKPTGTPAEKVFKPFKKLKDANGNEYVDPTNPFGAAIKEKGQTEYTDADGKTRLSAVNKIKEESDWEHYSKTLASQFLAKQPKKLIETQLNLTYADKLAEYDEIMSISNPTIRKKLLLSFADGCDSAAVELKATALPRQSSKVILPITTLKDNEVYAPTYEDGETVALIRYPHGGLFEIPILKVNNKNKEGNSTIGNDAVDAIGINSKVAERLSGADFDGDTVTVIPCNSYNSNVRIMNEDPLPGLKDFDPKEKYPYVEGMKVMSKGLTQTEMGKISNLITDMTALGADKTELAQAVRHSMVVIDAEKHKLNYQQSYVDNHIAELNKKYHGGVRKGAATLLSRASSQEFVSLRKLNYDIDKKTGEKIWTEAPEYYYKNGKLVERKLKSTRMAETTDARTLMSKAQTVQEQLYAQYANNVKGLANQARLSYLNTPNTKRDPEAAKTYANEVTSLTAKLNIAQSNAPRERQAQIIARIKLNKILKDNPDMAPEDTKKIRTRYINEARTVVGAKKKAVDVTDKEWEAIQAGAISQAKLSAIISNMKDEDLKKRAMPKQTTTLSSAEQNRIAALKASGYTIKEIADALGRSTSTISKYIK